MSTFFFEFMTDVFIWKRSNYKKAKTAKWRNVGLFPLFFRKVFCCVRLSAKCTFPIPYIFWNLRGYPKIHHGRHGRLCRREIPFFYFFFHFSQESEKMCRLTHLIVLNQNSRNCQKKMLYEFLADGWTSLFYTEEQSKKL